MRGVRRGGGDEALRRVPLGRVLQPRVPEGDWLQHKAACRARAGITGTPAPEAVVEVAVEDWVVQAEVPVPAGAVSAADDLEAGIAASLEHADATAQRLNAPLAQALLSSRAAAAPEAQVGEELLLLDFTRSPEAFRDALLDGPELAETRDALTRHGFDCVLPTGTKVFAHPTQYRACFQAIVGRSLSHSHVLVVQSLEPLVQAAVGRIRSKEKVRRKSREPVGAVPEPWQVKYERTFLCVVSRDLDGSAVVQSTSAARGLNHRRRVVD